MRSARPAASLSQRMMIVSRVRTGLPHQAAGAARTECDDHAPRAALAAEIKLRGDVLRAMWQTSVEAAQRVQCAVRACVT